MAERVIFKEDDEILFKRSRTVVDFDRKLGQLIDDMFQTMYKADGAGLAAPQVGILKRVAVIDADGVKLELVNPEIIDEEGEQIAVEGCLSVDPQKNCRVLRPMTVVVQAYDRNGEKYVKTLTGLAARACCHETDHLDGILFYQRKYREKR